MKIKSAIITEASGSIGGLTASHNRGGLYFRARTIPVNPNTPQQQAIRGFVAQLANLWLNTLTEVQRTAWDTYALQVPLPDRLGEPRNVGGLAMYIRSNVPRLQIGFDRIDVAPTTFNLGDYTTPTMGQPTAATQQFPVVFSETDAWVLEEDSALAFWVSRPQNPSINYFKGPYRYSVAIAGDPLVPPTSPQNINVSFPFVAGQKIFIRTNVTRIDGRLGTEQFASAIAVA